MSPRLLVGIAVACFAVGCGNSSSRSGFDDDGSSGGAAGGDLGGSSGGLGDAQAPDDPHADECEKMDIVFVVDDSKSMTEEQANLAANFPKFVQVIEGFKTKSGAALDWRAAITTTGRDLKYTIAPGGPFPPIPFNEKGDDGAFRMGGDCGTTQRWVDGTDTAAASKFSCLAEVGTSGPSLEMPLRVLDLAFHDRMTDGTNAGFLRADALLATVILTDEDDCSREDNDFTIPNDVCATMSGLKPVEDYAKMLDDVAGGPGRWATAVIAGQTACSSAFGDASDAVRLKKFVSLAGKNGVFSSICAGDLTSALQTALATFDAACKNFPPVR